MIKVTELSKIFRTEEIETTALNGVSFEIKKGEFVAIMGPSGCGKSTLLNILGLLDNPSGGSYELMGQEVAQLKERDRTKFRKGNIGFVYECFGTETACDGHAQTDEYQSSCPAFPATVIRRTATACCHCAGGYFQSESGIGRRADRKPGFQERERSNGLADGTEFGRNNDCHGNALAEGCFRGSANYQLV